MYSLFCQNKLRLNITRWWNSKENVELRHQEIDVSGSDFTVDRHSPLGSDTKRPLVAMNPSLPVGTGVLVCHQWRPPSDGRYQSHDYWHHNQLLCLSQLIMWSPRRVEPELEDAELARQGAFDDLLQWPAARWWPPTPSLVCSGNQLTNTEWSVGLEISPKREEGVLFYSEPRRHDVGGRSYWG